MTTSPPVFCDYPIEVIEHLEYLAPVEDPTKLTSQQGRLRIAEDVLAALDASRITATQARYYVGPNPTLSTLSAFIRQDKQDTQVKALLPAHCGVCSLGAMFIAAIDRFNDHTCKDMYNAEYNCAIGTGDEFNVLTDLLQRWWEPRDMHLIECAFESGGGDMEDEEVFNKEYGNASDYRAAETMFKGCDDDITAWRGPKFPADLAPRSEYKLRSIMHNILDHDGDFDPWVHVIPPTLTTKDRKRIRLNHELLPALLKP